MMVAIPLSLVGDCIGTLAARSFFAATSFIGMIALARGNGTEFGIVD